MRRLGGKSFLIDLDEKTRDHPPTDLDNNKKCAFFFLPLDAARWINPAFRLKIISLIAVKLFPQAKILLGAEF